MWNLLKNEEVLSEIRQWWSGNKDFVFAPGCTPVLSAESKNGGNVGTGVVTRVQVLRNVDILHFS